MSQQPASHASVLQVFKGQKQHLEPLIYLPVHVISLVLKTSGLVSHSGFLNEFLELICENFSAATVSFCAQINPAVGVIADG